MRSPSPTRSAKVPTTAGLGARQAAHALLQHVLDDGAPLDGALEALPALAKLDTRDRAFARLLAATVLRRLGQIDATLAGRLKRPLGSRNATVRHVLRLGAAQLAFLDTPPHAAIDSSVALTRRLHREGMTGLVNGVLRALQRDPPTVLIDEKGAARRNTPGWLWQSWAAAYGEETAAAIARAHITNPPLDLTLSPGAGTPTDWAARLDAELLPTGTLRKRDGGMVPDLPGYDDGAWWVQDAAAALPARLFGDIAGKQVIDLCAAPGGKTAQLAAAGARVTAVDLSQARLARVADNLGRLGLSAELVCADAGDYAPPQPAPAILLDAPCTATGTIRRHPDIAHLKSPGDVAAVVPVQDRLLRAAANMLAPGGTLVYAVCSLQPEEGPQRIAALLADTPSLSRAPVAADEIPGLVELTPAAITADGDVRTLPCHLDETGGMDGFYIARLRHA